MHPGVGTAFEWLLAVYWASPVGAQFFFVMGVREDATSRGAKHFHRLVPIYINEGGGGAASKKKVLYLSNNVQ